MTIHFVDVNAIQVAETRQRREFKEDAHQELIASIQGPSGLQNPPVLRLSNGQYVLVSGERRLRAIKEIYDLGGSFRYNGQTVLAGTIPFNNLGEMDPLDAMEAELDENIKRSDLTWQERSRSMSELFELRRLQYEERGGPVPPTPLRIAEEVGRISDGVKEILIARHLSDPDVAAATSVREAHKVLVKKEERAKNERLAAVVGRTHSSSSHTLLQRESRDAMAEMQPETFDIICTDPPYGMGADAFGDSGSEGTGVHTYSDDAATLYEIMQWFCPESFRVAKPNAHLYLFCDIEWFSPWQGRMQEAGWKVFRTPFIWNKTMGFRAPWPEHGPKRSYELILYAMKGDKKVTSLQSDVITVSPVNGVGHPAAKPVDLMRNLLARSAIPGDKVLDPFMGSGSTIEAAHGLKLIATGIERDANYFGLAVKRIGAMV